ncbi:trehalase family glycosidase [Lentisphaerota bacterium ZTH]|nr:hypothetical protein JYG24_04495 [Lentisphaerota bacterium]WET07232.1 trehalase family glycosidase [Lentisphaerota bacterium ZTH]
MNSSENNKKIIIQDLHKQKYKDGKVINCGPVVIEWNNNQKPPEVLQVCLDELWQNDNNTTIITHQKFREMCVIPYMTGLWFDNTSLFRNLDNIAETAADNLVLPQLEKWRGWTIYYPHKQNFVKDLIAEKCPGTNLSIEPLPDKKPACDSESGKKLYNDQGLLFLPNPYAAMGGVFTDMYGWGSYYIIQGLLSSAEYIIKNKNAEIYTAGVKRHAEKADAIRLFQTAKGMVDNLIYEINFYGGFVLNSNRTYLMTRSQPPLFTRGALAVYDFQKNYAELLGLDYTETLAEYIRTEKPGFTAPTTFDEWMTKEVLPAAVSYYNYWTNPRFDTQSWKFRENTKSQNPRVVTLIDNDNDKKYTAYRYSPEGRGPILESVRCVMPQNNQLYPDAALFFSENPDKNPVNLKSNLHLFWDPECNNYYNLTEEFYAADRAMRESGFDLSGRYGKVGQYTNYYAPVCLNSLLYRMGQDIISIYDKHNAPKTVSKRLVNRIRMNAPRLEDLINNILWNSDSDYYADARLENNNELPAFTYEYATSFYPLWAGVVKDSSRIAKIIGSKLLNNRHYGVPTSLQTTGNNCDFPFVRAPIQNFIVDAMHNAATEYAENSRTIAQEVMDGFTKAVDIVFAETGQVFECYNCEEPAAPYTVKRGYDFNQTGYGWTNGVYMQFISDRI